MDGTDKMTEQTPRRRAPKASYEFHLRRHGDVIALPDAKARVMYLSAFVNWNRNRPGTLSARSRKAADGYVVTFDGISPAEHALATLTA